MDRFEAMSLFVGVTEKGSLSAASRALQVPLDAEREAAGEFSVPKGELVITAPMLFGRLRGGCGSSRTP